MNNHVVTRGDIFVYDFGNNTGSIQRGVRPAIVLQNNVLNEHSPAVIVAPISSVQKKLTMSAHVVLGQRFGLLKPSIILLEQSRAVSKCKLGPYIGHVDDEHVIRLVDQGLCEILGIQVGSRSEDNSSEKEVLS